MFYVERKNKKLNEKDHAAWTQSQIKMTYNLLSLRYIVGFSLVILIHI